MISHQRIVNSSYNYVNHLANFIDRFAISDLFVKMKFPNKKLKYLHKYMEFMVDYVSGMSEDTFSDSVYAK